jgi:hypothetical protein
MCFALFHRQVETFQDFLAFDADVQILDDQLGHKYSFYGLLTGETAL